MAIELLVARCSFLINTNLIKPLLGALNYLAIASLSCKKTQCRQLPPESSTYRVATSARRSEVEPQCLHRLRFKPVPPQVLLYRHLNTYTATQVPAQVKPRTFQHPTSHIRSRHRFTAAIHPPSFHSLPTSYSPVQLVTFKWALDLAQPSA